MPNQYKKYLSILALACESAEDDFGQIKILQDAEDLRLSHNLDIDGLHLLEWKLKTGMFYIINQKNNPAKYVDSVEKYVYFIQSSATKYIKIGSTHNVKKRIKQLSNSSSEPLVLLGKIKGGKKLETELHRKFSAINHCGEWFCPDKKLIDFILGVNKESSND